MTDCDIQSSGRGVALCFACLFTRFFNVGKQKTIKFLCWYDNLKFSSEILRYSPSHVLPPHRPAPESEFGRLRRVNGATRMDIERPSLFKASWHTSTHTPPTRRWWIDVHICTTEECLCLTHVAHPRVSQSVRHLSASVITWYMVL